ncbi:MAG: ester cyclase [bacterium]
MTTTEQSRSIVERLHLEIFQKGRMELLDEIVAEDYVVHTPTGDQSRDRHFGEELPMFLNAFPDLAFHPLDRIAEGDKVVTRFVFTGTHDGEFQGIPATGREIELPGIVIERVEAGKVVETWVQRNDLSLLQQLGVAPAPGSG